ncbi:MAG: hypothetical protein WA876_07725 [Candidatus Acidiferrales bacterium]
MRKGIWLAAILAALVMPRLSAAQQASPSAPTSQSSSDKQTTAQSKTKTQPQAASQTTATKSDSLADAARKAREAQKNAPKAPMVFTNDNIPTSPSGVSVVGESAASSSDQSASSDTQAGAAASKNDEETWRKRFADARLKIDQDTSELSVMQREMGELNVQYYPDPTKALMQSVTRADLIKKQNAIDAKQKELDADKQALSNLEDELRKAGGDPGWARE